jgi:hypothetical protein
MLKTKLRFNLLFLLFILVANQTVQAQCPGCIIALPPLSADTIYLSPAPDGEVFVPYNADLSFRLPMTSTPIAATDPSVPPGLTIDEFNITGIAGLPPGLDYEFNQTMFNPAEETDGCVKICGTPVIADSFFVEVLVDVVVFGINNPSSFVVPVYIAPSVSTTDGFAMSNNSGCGETTVEFTNNVPSNGDPGYSYFWNFGNGDISTEENPAPVTYDSPGTYVVEYQASIDTIGFILTQITVEASGCDDIIGDPDFFAIISDPNGDEIQTTFIVNDSPPPVTFPVNIPLGPGNYSIEIRDDELVGSVSCGTVNFTQNTMGSLFDGELEVSLNILNPVSTVTSSDTVFVYEIPAAPVVGDPLVEPCQGEEVLLEIVDNNYPDNLQWYQDSMPVSGATEDMLAVTEAGDYWVTYTSAEGCFVSSEVVTVSFTAAPAVPEFAEVDNILLVADISLLPTAYNLSWFLGTDLVYSGQETELCVEESGLYTLVVEDLVTGCTSSFELEVEADPTIPCSVSTTEEFVSLSGLYVYPNPFRELLEIDLADVVQGPVQLRLHAIDGTILWNGLANPGEKIEIGTSELPAGFYILHARSADAQQTIKLIKS